MDALVHAIEINHRHGVGVYLQRLFGHGYGFVVVRSRTLYGGRSELGIGDFFMGGRFDTLAGVRRRLAKLGRDANIRRILCVPYYPEDFRHAVLLKEMTGAKLCTYLMDDQNLFAGGVGDHHVRQLLGRSDLRLGISPQMCLAYEQAYGFPLSWMPPVLDAVSSPEGAPEVRSTRAALLGNFWSAGQFEAFRTVIREADLEVDWFGDGWRAEWLQCSREELESGGIHVQGFVDEAEIAKRLAGYAFALVPSGTLDERDDNRAFSCLSLPSRIVHVLGRAALPILVLGSEETAAAAFVLEFGVGGVASYDASSLRRAAATLRGPARQEELRAAIARTAEAMTMPDGGAWIWRSLEAGRAADDRFERLRTGRLARVGMQPPQRSPLPRASSRIATLKRITGIDPFADRQWLRFSRRGHLRAVRRFAPIEATGPHTFDVGMYQQALVIAIVRARLQKGRGVVVLVGERLPAIERLLGDYAIEWVKSSEIGATHFPDAGAVVSLNARFPSAFGANGGLRAAIERCGGSGALHIHCWTAWQHPGHFEAEPCAMNLLDELDDRGAVGDAILDAEDFLFMSERAIQRFWRSAGVEMSAVSGRPFSLNLVWNAGRKS
jgi:hypothetical protein